METINEELVVQQESNEIDIIDKVNESEGIPNATVVKK